MSSSSFFCAPSKSERELGASASSSLPALRLEDGLFLLRRLLAVLVREGAADADDQECRHRDADEELEALLGLVAVQRRELVLVRLLRRHRLHARAMLRLGARLLELTVLDGLEPRLFFFSALFFSATALFLCPEARLFGVTPRAFLGGLGIGFLADATFLVGFFLADAGFLEAHQLLEREENRAFLLFGHGGYFPEWADIIAAARVERQTANSNR